MAVITDSENHYDKIGDFDGGRFDEKWLKYYISFHGNQKLLEAVSSMTHQIVQTTFELNRQQDELPMLL